MRCEHVGACTHACECASRALFSPHVEGDLDLERAIVVDAIRPDLKHVPVSTGQHAAPQALELGLRRKGDVGTGKGGRGFVGREGAGGKGGRREFASSP